MANNGKNSKSTSSNNIGNTNGSNNPKQPHQKEAVIGEATVSLVQPKLIWVSLDEKKDYSIPIEEFGGKVPALGDKVKVCIKRIKNEVVLSKKDADEQMQVSMESLEDYRDKKIPVKGRFIKYKDGHTPSSAFFIVELFGGRLIARCFASHVDLGRQENSDIRKQYLDEKKLKDEYDFLIVKVPSKGDPNYDRQTVTVSRRDFLFEEKNKEYDNFYQNVKPGDIVDVYVKRIHTPNSMGRDFANRDLTRRNDQRKDLKDGENPQLAPQQNGSTQNNPQPNKVNTAVSSPSTANTPTNTPTNASSENTNSANITNQTAQTSSPQTSSQGQQYRESLDKNSQDRQYVVVSFVSYPSVSGTIEKDEVSWGYVGNIRSALGADDKNFKSRDANREIGKDSPKTYKIIKAKVLTIDKDKKEIKLSHKATKPDPWPTFADRHQINDKIEGTITNTKENLGVFVHLDGEDGIEGMIHISDLTDGQNSNLVLSETFKKGDKITVKILGFDLVAHKISLSRMLQEDTTTVKTPSLQKNAKLKKRISKIEKDMIVVEIDKGTEGFVTREDISWIAPAESLSNLYKVGDEVEAMVLSTENPKRVKLGIKQLTEDPLARFRSLKNSGRTIEAVVLDVMKDSIIVDLENGIKGTISERDMSDEQPKKGDKIRCSVVAIKSSGVVLSNKKATSQQKSDRKDGRDSGRDMSRDSRERTSFSFGSKDDEKVTLKDILNKDKDK